MGYLAQRCLCAFTASPLNSLLTSSRISITCNIHAQSESCVCAHARITTKLIISS
ncbi:hypothetical protein Hanom_Chr14g01251851 [Helianthus anomalus]